LKQVSPPDDHRSIGGQNFSENNIMVLLHRFCGVLARSSTLNSGCGSWFDLVPFWTSRLFNRRRENGPFERTLTL
jgi:hypothetical protein